MGITAEADHPTEDPSSFNLLAVCAWGKRETTGSPLACQAGGKTFSRKERLLWIAGVSRPRLAPAYVAEATNHEWLGGALAPLHAFSLLLLLGRGLLLLTLANRVARLVRSLTSQTAVARPGVALDAHALGGDKLRSALTANAVARPAASNHSHRDMVAGGVDGMKGWSEGSRTLTSWLKRPVRYPLRYAPRTGSGPRLELGTNGL